MRNACGLLLIARWLQGERGAVIHGDFVLCPCPPPPTETSTLAYAQYASDFHHKQQACAGALVGASY